MRKIFSVLVTLCILIGLCMPANTAYAEVATGVSVEIPEKPYDIKNVVSGVHVYWKAVSNVTKYGVWRSEDGVNGSYKWLANPGVAHFTDTNVISGKTYYYKITSMDSVTGKHTEKSPARGIMYVSTPDITGRENTVDGVKLDWNKVDGASGYRIYRKGYNDASWESAIVEIAGNETFSWTDTKAENGTVYRYTIRALGGTGKTLSGCRNTGRTMVRLTDRTLTEATATGDTAVKVVWGTTAKADGYEVRFTSDDGVVKNFTVGNYKTGVKTFTGLATDKEYKIQVRCYKKIEDVGTFYSTWSEEKIVTLGNGSTVEPAPEEIPTPEKPYKITNVVNGVHVYWKAIEGVAKYGVWRSETGENGTYKWLGNPTMYHFTDKTAKSGVTYHYKITVCGEDGKTHGAKSKAIGITYVATPDITGRVNTADGVALAWDEIAGATGYAVYRKSYEGSDAWARITTISGTDTLEWTDATAEDGIAYRYTVRALAGSDLKTLSGCRNTGRTMVRLGSSSFTTVEVMDSASVKCTWETLPYVTGYEICFIKGESKAVFKVEGNDAQTKIFSDLEEAAAYKVQIRNYKVLDGVGTFYSDWSEPVEVSKKVTLTGKVADLEEAEVGDSVFLGMYEQDSNTENGAEPIEWYVLDVQDGKALLLSKYVLYQHYFGSTGLSADRVVTWEQSALRNTLNNAFFNAAFSEEDKERIYYVTLETDYNLQYGTSNGNATFDRVFALSLSEAESYFENYADWVGIVAGTENTANWWLRSRGAGNKFQAVLGADGSLKYDGRKYTAINSNAPNEGVRPAIWVLMEEPEKTKVTTNEDAIVPDGNKVVLEEAYPGAYVSFGKYNQDDDATNGEEEIEWIVLDVEDGKALLLSRYVLDAVASSPNNVYCSWGTSNVRSWLNGDFYDGAFSEAEKAQIRQTMLEPAPNGKENVLNDNVFVLSEKETIQYFKISRNFTAGSTVRAQNAGAKLEGYGYCKWLLRPDSFTSVLSCFGDGVQLTTNSITNSLGIRPAMWVDIETASETPGPNKFVHPTGELVDISKAYPGATVQLGNYEQDSTTEGLEPVEWIVLDVRDDKALLLSKYVLFHHYFGSTGLSSGRILTWEGSALRSVLNNNFFNSAFSEEEKEIVCDNGLETDYNPRYGNSNGNATKDRVFALSLSEAETYFENYEDWVGVAAGTENTVNWWLRSRGAANKLQAIVSKDGYLQYFGREYTTAGTNAPSEGVRPAIWVKLQNLNEDVAQTNPDAIVPDGNMVALEDAYPGAYIKFGKYNYDNDASNGDEDIEWIVLDVEDGKVLVLSRYVLEGKSFAASNDLYSWGTSSVRTWLNETFYAGAFSEEEKARINANEIAPPNTSEDEATQDKVFVLSEDETIRYFKYPRNFTINSTYHANGSGVNTKEPGYCNWLLRPERYTNRVKCFGDGVTLTTYAGADTVGIRPAMWLTIETASETPGPNKFVHPTGELVDINKAYPGATVQLGSYEQDSATEGMEPVEWIVLDVQDDKVLLLSKYVLFHHYFGSTGLSTGRVMTWEESTLRNVLNDNFFNSAFNEEEKAIICDNGLETDYNPRYGTSNGNATKDKVFALSLSEAETYFENYEDWVGVAAGTENTVNWWLRSRGAANRLQAIVSKDGYLQYFGREYTTAGTNAPEEGVRPVLWVSKEAIAPTATPTPKPTAMPTPKPTATPTPKPTATPTPKPTATPTPKPTATPTPKPTATPTPKPTATPLPTATPVPDRDPIEEEIEFLPGDFTYGTKEGYYVCTGLSDSGFEKFEKYLSKDTVTICFPTVSDTGDEVEGFCSDSKYDLGTLEKQTEPFMRLVFPDTYLVYYGETGSAPERVLSVELGEGLEFIAQKSFYGYTGLTSLVLPSSICEYEKQVFDGCTNLVIDTLYTEDVKMGSKVFNGVTINNVILSESFDPIDPEAAWSSPGAFAGAAIKAIVYEEGMERIPDDAFRDCTSLTKVVVPTGVEIIGCRAFCDCSELVTLELPDTVELIEKQAFKDCVYLRKFTVPNTVIEFGTEAFMGCSKLKISEFDTAGKTVWGEAFSGVTIEDVIICENFNAISPDTAWKNTGAFKGAILETVSFEEGIKKIPDDAFRDCTSITEIEIPDTVTVIGMRAFYSCTNLESVVLPESVTEIQKQAFAYCNVLEEIELTDAIQTYGAEAFYKCPELYIREFNTQTKTICYSVFYGVTIGELIVSKDFVPATEWKENGVFDGALLERLTFEEGMTKIPDYLLRDCGSIVELVIPEGVQSIGTRAFFRCSKLELVVLPSSLTEIGEQAFRYCSALKDINVPVGTIIGDNAFSDCNSLESIPQ